MDILDTAYANLLQLLVVTIGAVLIVSMMILRKGVIKWLKKHVVADTLRDDSRIKELMVEVRVTTSADRVSVFLFHNGEKYVNGQSILRLSGAYESLANGICSHRDTSQNMLVSTVSEAVSFLVTSPFDKVFFQKVEDIDVCYYQAVLISQGVKSVAKYPLRKDNDIIGFICADFVQTDGPGEDKLEIIKTTAPQIELYLNSRVNCFKRILARILGGG